MKVVYFDPNRYDQVPKPCTELIYPYQRFLTTNIVIPMTWQQKGYLALHDLTDPANFGTILGISAITIGADSHTAYGPGLKGFGKSRRRQPPAGRHRPVLRSLRYSRHRPSGPALLPHASRALHKAPHLLHLSHRHLAQRQRQVDAQLRHSVSPIPSPPRSTTSTSRAFIPTRPPP